MAEENAPVQPQLSIQRIYLKDISFESPRSPMVFQEEWKPEVGLELNTKSRQVGENLYEVVLDVTVNVKNNNEAAYLVQVQQGGLFTIAGFEERQLHHALGAFCPGTLFPYARENIDSIITKGSFNPVMLAPINFDALYLESLQKQQAEQPAQ
ncbi:protein-export chaperone SecB [Maribrevibacterium harenarium]|jgi:preprotein translocase subunit SecB|uniref:Protein-export protein SecB n=1 Tax=Maribrevibacterium harenarium TaxID=2589817 RepID=A0A501X1K4_9GAMM|nr:protein-export chaperone SecB [Maribrevibacterium harenarium]TPE54357.1 protein-export chaperone SecB [Maribrevibacterium harenarium]